MLSPKNQSVLWKDVIIMVGAVGLPTLMLRFGDWKEALMDRLGKIPWIIKIVKITHFKKPLRIIDYQHRQSFLLYILKNCFNCLILIFLKQIEKSFTDMDIIALLPNNKIFTY